MPLLIDSIFGKSYGLTKKDVEEKILGVVSENQTIDCKQMPNLKGSSRDSCVEGCIVKPIVGFLNSIDGKGLIILGIQTEKSLAKQILPVSESFIKDEEQLRALILSQIGSVPHSTNMFEFYIVSIPIDSNGKVFLVELEKSDRFCVYYSKITQKVYVRHGDETQSLNLPEVLAFVSSKITSKVFVYFEKTEKTNWNDHTFKFNAVFKNEGTEPAKNVISNIRLNYDSSYINATLDGSVLIDVSHINKDFKRAYQTSSMHSLKSILLYPNLPTVFGELTITARKDFEVVIVMQTWESKGFTSQNISISNKDGKTDIKNRFATFNPYL